MKKEEFKSQEEGFLESFEEYMKQNLERIGCGTPFINREIKKREMKQKKK
jgi:hypothetical protein